MKTPNSPEPKPGPVPDDAARPLADDSAVATETEDAASKPEPEPWTPQRVREWNAYYDLFVAGFALLLCFVAAATYLSNPTIWSYLRAGQLIEAQGGPITVEPFSYAAEGIRWINVPWLFEWVSYRIYAMAANLAPSDPQQYAAGALVAVHAVIRVLTALVLLNIRRRGPGLWWTAITTSLALGAILEPMAAAVPVRPAIGGIVGLGSSVSPATWGLLMLAIVLLALHSAYNLGRRWAVFATIPVFALWANLDESFAIGLILMLMIVVGSGLRPGRAEEPERRSPGLGTGLLTLILSALACMLNPSTYHVYLAGFAPLVKLFTPVAGTLTQDQVTLLPIGDRGRISRDYLGSAYPSIIGFHVILVGLGLGSFLLNWRRLDLGRLLLFLAASLLAAMLLRLQDVFALVWAVSIALNGQEWFQDRFGTEGKLGLGWRIWSVGGRLVTILLLTLATLVGLTGFGRVYGEPPFGFGVDPDRFAFEAADYLKDAPIEGRVMNLRLSLGDALNWRAYPEKKPYLDTRTPLFTDEYIQQFEQVRSALLKGDAEIWRPILDEYNVSVLMVDVSQAEPLGSPLTRVLDASPDWLPFYIDGDVMLYGRLDPSVSESDRTYFESHVLDAEAIVFERGNPVAPFVRTPQPMGLIDRVFRTRSLVRTQPHVKAALYWLARGERQAEAAGELGPSLASCLLAIQETRDALAVKPDDPDAYYYQGIAYRHLNEREAQLLIDAGNAEVAAGALIPPLRVRLQQRMTALNYFIQTIPKPVRDEHDRETLRNAHLELATLYQSLGYLDLARDQFAAVLALSSGEDDEEAATPSGAIDLTAIRQTHEQLNETVEQIESQIEQAEIEGQADPAQLAAAAAQQGTVALAIRLLENAEQSGVSLATVRMQLVDLFCDTGQPDRALPYLGSSANEPSLGTSPGAAAFRQGRVWFLLGDYRTAVELWRRFAIPQLQASRSLSVLQASQMILAGAPQEATQTMLNVPSQIAQQAEWEYLLGIALLEGGFPDEAGEPLRKALELNPDLTAGPIAAEYLRRLGQDVPEPAEEADEAEESASASASASTAPEDSGTPDPAEASPTPESSDSGSSDTDADSEDAGEPVRDNADSPS